MKRIIDEEYVRDSPEYLLAQLVRTTPRLSPAPFRRERIFAEVVSAASPSRANRRGPWPAIAAVVSILAGATIAAAAVGHFRFANPSHPAPVAAATALPLVPVVASPAAAARADLAPAADETSPPDVPPAPTASSTSIERPSARLRSNVPPKDGEDPTLVLEAIRALRYDGDPSRAGTLLAQYLKAHPHGVLSEDAAALSIEAAIARHDSRSSAELGARYLAQFPRGRYRAFAVQTVQASAQ